ncbi:electron transport complex subunit RsxC [Psychromonas sp. Urea-02u-13]|uniref:electron transport complex subunit RsxC n=1 Tax=Psychromonas sp. Urea-02u-13 TaxID=2058326 RepID=UPI000C328A95|nr:electron transport complex subunit RsxC [Psychromonas sp. Urea-02u-13]PKG40346.1 electron transport complex subunit RsxC [Psychromonas sp. Urea-02u-13]
MTDKFNLLSDEQLDAISSGKLWNFHGGIHPEENKLQSNQYAIRDAGIPATLVIPVEHKGHTPELLVAVGDMVLKGQPLTKVYGALVVQHASSSGVVIAIEKRCDLHPSGLGVLAVVIQTDGLDRTAEYVKPQDYQTLAPAVLVEKIQQSGIVGLGGAGFPSHLKLVHHSDIKLLLINAAECEPYITADDRLMQEQSFEILEGIEVLNHILQPQLTVIAIEDNKVDAIKSLQEALSKNPNKDKIRLRIIPTIYPSGSEKQLIEIITGQQTPLGKHPSELGIVMQNIGTVFAIKQAIIDAKPLTSRIVTLTGDSLQQRGNVSVRIGTPIQYLLDRYWVNSTSVNQLIIGGPMMGFTIEDTSAPVTKTCNCILAPTVQEMPASPPEMPCIRCSECAEACPAHLLPQQLLWYSKSQDHDKLAEYNLSACIECGACAFVCPSHIPLVEYYRVAKAEINVAKNEAQKAEVARIRHEKREARLEQAKLDRQAKHKAAAEKRKAQLQEKNGGEDLIAAALARAKAKKVLDGASSDASDSSTEKKPENKNSAVAAAIARAKAKKAAKAQSLENTESSENAEENSQDNVSIAVDPKKVAVAAAIARAKAKKAAKAGLETNSEPTTAKNTDASTDEPAAIDPKKAAVAAAIARAKAKKAAKAGLENIQENKEKSKNIGTDEPIAVDPQKAAVAAAIARAKAKKAAKAAQSENPEENSESSTSEHEATAIDPKKAAVAAAIARAKAKKAAKTAQALDAQNLETTAPTSAELPDNSKVIAERKLRKEQARLHKQEKEEAVIARQQTITVEAQSDITPSSSPELSAADIKKAKIAAVVARAKAKKAQLAKESENDIDNKEQQ